jgi:hypothetical protein
MTEYFGLEMTDDSCEHKDCQCAMHVQGIHPTTAGYKYVSSGVNIDDHILDAGAHIASSFQIRDGKPTGYNGDKQAERIKLSLRKDAAIKPAVVKKGFKGGWPESRLLCNISTEVSRALAVSDFRHLTEKFGKQLIDWDFLAKHVWRPVIPDRVSKKTVAEDVMLHDDTGLRKVTVMRDRWEIDPEGSHISDPIPSLAAMILKKESGVWQTTGTIKGRKFVTAAMENLHPDKYADALLNMNKPTQKPPAAFEEIKSTVPRAMDLLYHKMGIHEYGKEKNPICLGPLDGMYLGASNGINFGKHFVISDPDFECPVEVSPKGKKLETFASDINEILHFIRTGEEPPVYWNITPKNENFFSWTKQMSDDEWESWKKKVRLFVIPSSIYILGEKLVSRLRHLKERGWVIAIGYSHSRGGADKIAKMLGVTLMNCWAKIIEEGDAKNFDQTVLEFFTNLYFSTMQIHEDPTQPDFEIKRRITKWLLSNMIVRLTRIFAEQWAWIRGQVPSGCYNTSHMDSWIMAMYFFIFGLVTIDQAPAEHQVELEEALYNRITLIVYGDDHLYNKGTGLAAQYFSAHRFADFAKKYYGVEIRDLKSGLPFCSRTFGGWITEMGATFLKHQFVLNPNKSEGQCNFLPFRESREFLIRAIWGRETDERGILDVILSCIGHAYGTYGANRDAYDRLRLLYEECVKESGMKPGKIIAEILESMSRDDLGKIRQLGISTDDVMMGFPTWETLQTKNIMDWSYHNNIVNTVDYDYPDIDP